LVMTSIKNTGGRTDMNLNWTIIPEDVETCSREKLIERLKIADKIIHNYVELNGHEKLIEMANKED
jgi:hypothetical protein